MEFRNFLLFYSILSLFLVFPINILGESISNHLRKETGGNSGNNIQRKLEEQDNNYIVIKYDERVCYRETPKQKTFKHLMDNLGVEYDYRKAISKIYYEHVFLEDYEMYISPGRPFYIYFSEPIEDMSYFFSGDFDLNCNHLSYVDFSHFDSSKLKTTYYMFGRTSSLREVNLTNFKAENLVNMDYMFHLCTNLISLDLSSFTAKSVVNMNYMCNFCQSVKYLDISNLNPKIDNLGGYSNMFNGFLSLKYLKISNVKNEILKSYIKSIFNTKSDLIICQSEDILDNNDGMYACCEYTNTTENCKTNNYMIVKYGNQVDYNEGFNPNNYIPSRNQIGYIAYSGIRTDIDTKLNIRERPDSIEIYFFRKITSFDNFFNGEIDTNSKSIISVDLSHLNTPLLTNTSKMFFQCTSIKEINFINFDISSVESMSEMFSGCSLITSLNLSSFKTSNTIDMSGMFNGCDNLEILDISNFDTTNCDSYNNMFSNYANLKYIDIKNLKNDHILKDSFINTKLFYVCQSMDLIRNYYSFNCCEYDIENHECDYIPPTESYILITYMQEVDYSSKSFKSSIEARKVRSIIIYDDTKYGDVDFKIKANKQLKILFSEPIESLESFFDNTYDSNCEKISYIDLSHFDSSALKNTKRMFYGCYELKNREF